MRGHHMYKLQQLADCSALLVRRSMNNIIYTRMPMINIEKFLHYEVNYSESVIFFSVFPCNKMYAHMSLWNERA